MSIDQYSSTPASNDLTNYFKTGMRPSAVKTAGWDVMADLKDNHWSLVTAGGTANAQTVTNSRALGGTDPFTGQTQWFLPVAANSGAATLKVDGQSVKSIFAYGAALLGGELQPTVPALVKYDGTQWNLLNPNDASGSFTLTLTGFSSNPSGTVNWRIIQGRLAVITLYTDITGTSNATTMTGTGIPIAIQPVNTIVNTSVAIRDGGNGAQGGQVVIPNSSTWTFGNAPPIISGSFPRSFTSSGSKGLFAQTFTYPLKQ